MTSQRKRIPFADSVNKRMPEDKAREIAQRNMENLKAPDGSTVTELLHYHEDPFFLRDGYFSAKLSNGEICVLRVVAKPYETREAINLQYIAGKSLAENPFPQIQDMTERVILMDSSMLNPETGELHPSAYEHADFDPKNSTEQLQKTFHSVMTLQTELIVRGHKLSNKILKTAETDKLRYDPKSEEGLHPADGWFNSLDKIDQIDEDKINARYSDIFRQATKQRPIIKSELDAQKADKLILGNTHPGAIVMRPEEQGGPVLIGTEGIIGHAAHDFRHLLIQPSGNIQPNSEKAKELNEKVKNFDLLPTIKMMAEKSGTTVKEIAACSALHAATMLARQFLSEQENKENLIPENLAISESFKEHLAHRYKQLAEIAGFDMNGLE